jgi:hypothetical protein
MNAAQRRSKIMEAAKRLSVCRRPIGGLLLAAVVLTAAQPLVLTIRTYPTCPIETLAVAESKEFGFQSATFRNDFPIFVESVSLTVEFGAGSDQEIIESPRLGVHLAPGEERRFEVQLGRLQQLNQKLQSSGQEFARVVLFVDSAEFSDGTEWSSAEPVIDVPVPPEKLPAKK